MQVYVDTSVFGGYYDDEFKEWTPRFFDEVENGTHQIVTSALVEQGLTDAPENVRQLFARHKKNTKRVLIDERIIELAESYITEKVLTRKYFTDAIHIATATVHKIDVLVSWNFRHIVNLNKIRLFNAVNLKNGYLPVEIRSPREILNMS
jgi:predicted nucleic acid-binding protein